MSELKIINETPISIVETREFLEKIEKRDKELSEKATKTKEHINKITKKTPKDIKEIKKKLEAAGIARLKPRQIVKLLDIYPKDTDTIKTIFTSESITLKQEDINKILECFK